VVAEGLLFLVQVARAEAGLAAIRVLAGLADIVILTALPELGGLEVVGGMLQLVLSVVVAAVALEYLVKALLEPGLPQTQEAGVAAAALMVQVLVLALVFIVPVAHTEEGAGVLDHLLLTEEMGALAQFVSYGPAILAASRQPVLGTYEPLHRN
jgi:hypothetical protein